MDIVLATNVGNAALALRNAEIYDDGSGWRADLEVQSGWIRANYSFFCEIEPLRRFLAALERLDRDLTGSALLKPTYEDQFIAIEGTGLGGLIVRGMLVEHAMAQQRVDFAFRADQTCVRPLIRDLGCLLDEGAR